MKRYVTYKYIETVSFTDGTPPLVTSTEGTIFSTPAIVDGTDSKAIEKKVLLQWVRDNMGSGESRIGDFLFKNRRDPKHNRSKYECVTFEVIDAWIIENP